MSIGNIKSNLSSVILIPYWVADTVQRQGMPLSDVLDYEKIRPALSMHDMATFLAMQNEQGSLLYAGAGDCEVYLNAVTDLVAVWCHYTAAWVSDGVIAPFTKTPSAACQQTIMYSGDASVREDVTSRLYGSAVKLARYERAFEVVNLAPKMVGVIVYPGFFDNKAIDLRLQHELISALLQVFYVQGAQYHEIASTSLYTRHLELLSGE
jgi:hypothetical protein